MPEIIVEVIPDLKDILITWATLFVLYLLLTKLLYDPLTNFLNQRRKAIDDNVLTAKKEKEQAEALKVEYQQKLDEANEERQVLLKEARDRSIDIKEEILKEARTEAESIKNRAFVEIEREKANAAESLQKDTADMAMMIASKLLDRELTENDNQKIIDELIEEVGK